MLARARALTRLAFPRAMSSAAAASAGRKPGVASVEVVKAQAAKAGLVVVDVRNPNPDVEFEGTHAAAPVAGTDDAGASRPGAVNAVWNREAATLDMGALEGVAKDTPIITH